MSFLHLVKQNIKKYIQDNDFFSLEAYLKQSLGLINKFINKDNFENIVESVLDIFLEILDELPKQKKNKFIKNIIKMTLVNTIYN